MACGMGLHIMYSSDIIDNFSEAVNCCQPLKTCNAKFILVSTPELSNTQHAKKNGNTTLGWSLPINHHGWSPPIQQHPSGTSLFWNSRTNGFNTFLILNLMNPIPNLINPIFGFAAHYLGVNGEHLLIGTQSSQAALATGIWPSLSFQSPLVHHHLPMNIPINWGILISSYIYFFSRQTRISCLMILPCSEKLFQ